MSDGPETTVTSQSDDRSVGGVAAPTATARTVDVDWAIQTVAQQVLANAAEDADWGDYPEIGEHDWERITQRLSRLAPFPDDFDAAYEFLEQRAENI